MKLANVGIERDQQSLESLFKIEFDKALENIMDKRTFSGGKRKIQINVTLIPSDEREMRRIAYDIKTTLAPIIGGYTELEIEEHKDGSYNTRPSVSSHKIKGQVDFRDVVKPVFDEDGEYIESQEEEQ